MTEPVHLAIDNTKRRRPPGSGGDGEDMDQRVRLLETDMAYIKGKLEDMPTKEWVIVKFIWAIGAITAITALIEYGPALILRLSQ